MRDLPLRPAIEPRPLLDRLAVVVHRQQVVDDALLQPGFPVLESRRKWRLAFPVVGRLRTVAPGDDGGGDRHGRLQCLGLQIDATDQRRDLVAAPGDPLRIFGCGLATRVAVEALVEARDAGRVVAPAQ